MVQGRKFLSLTPAADLPMWSSLVLPGDELVVRGHWLEIVKVEMIRLGKLFDQFVNVNRPRPFSNLKKKTLFCSTGPSPSRTCIPDDHALQ